MFSSGKKLGMAVLAAVVVLTGGLFAAEITRSEARSNVSRQQAMQIAQQHVNGGRVVDSDFNNRWFRDNDYDFVVVDDMNRYEIRVDAETGGIISVDQTPIFEDNLSERDRARVASAIDLNRVREIAMERAPNGIIVDIDRDLDSDRVVYNVEMMANNHEIDMQVDGMTGRILAYDEERLEQRGRMSLRNRLNRNAGVNNANTAATTGIFGGPVGAVNRSAERLDHRADTLDRQASRLDRQAEALGDRAERMSQQARNVERNLSDRAREAAETLDRQADALDRQLGTLNRPNVSDPAVPAARR